MTVWITHFHLTWVTMGNFATSAGGKYAFHCAWKFQCPQYTLYSLCETYHERYSTCADIST